MTQCCGERLVSGDYAASPIRWYILWLTGMMGMVQSIIWMGWGTVSQSMYFAYPDWSDADIGLLGTLLFCLSSPLWLKID